MDVEETDDTEVAAFVPYKQHQKLKQELNQKQRECLKLQKKLDFMKQNYMRK
jgi:hypothetical protein